MKSSAKILLAVSICAGLPSSVSAASIGQLGILDSSTGLGVGDQYRLVFVTSTDIPRGAANSTNIGDYDTIVQNYANTAGYGSVSWQVIGSTASINAIDHTGTNGAGGVPIYLFDGVTLFAANNTDLWNGSADLGGGSFQGINIDEFGNSRTGDAWTGTAGIGGTGVASGLLGAADGTVATGRLTPINNFNWGNVFQRDPDGWDAGLYGISEVLTVPAAVVVPEPSSLVMAAFGGLIMIRRRR